MTGNTCNCLLETGSVGISALAAANDKIKSLEYELAYWKRTFEIYVAGAQKAGVVFGCSRDGVVAEYDPGLADALRERAT